MNKQKTHFNIEEELFVIDSNHLDEIETKFYGFSIQDIGIIERENFASKTEGINGCGAYVYIEKKGTCVTIKQDFNGSYGIFLFQFEDYFAISNSFYRLVEHLKYQHEITFNRDYANFLITMDLCSLAYSETMVNEIKLLSKNAVVQIDTISKKISIEYINYKEKHYELTSAEGIALLDDWFQRWTSFIRNLKAKTSNISVDLSGGIDSRITFLLALCSEIDLNEINVNSIDDKLHTHTEDYEIASQISDHFGFKLNNNDFSGKTINFCLEDILNICIYERLPFHKEIHYKRRKNIEKRYNFPGSGGEMIRSYWDMPPQKLVQKYINRTERYPGQNAEELKTSITKVFSRTFNELVERFDIKGNELKKLAAKVYSQIRSRNHFGTDFVDNYWANTYQLAPLMDPALSQLKLHDDICEDNNLLVSLIFVRYCPELLKFKFEGGRSIKKETVEHARIINQKFPTSKNRFNNYSSDQFEVLTIDAKLVGIQDENSRIPEGDPEKFLKSIFDSRKFLKSFTKYYDDSFYTFAAEQFKKQSYHPFRECYPIIAIELIYNAVEESRAFRWNTPFAFLNSYAKITPNVKIIEPASIVEQIKNHITARIDLKIVGDENADFEISYLSDKMASNRIPAWFQNHGKGHVIESYALSLDTTIRALTDGKFTIRLMGKDVRDKTNKRIPFWIDYQKIVHNDNFILDSISPAWHDKPIIFSFSVKSGEIIRLHIEWTPHVDTRSDLITHT